MSAVDPALSWGEEVLPGVHLFRRTHNPHVALAKRAHDAMLSGAPVEMSINYEKIHEDLESMRDMIERLEESNVFMRDYLAEAAVASNSGKVSEDDEGPRTADLHDDDDNECVREALKENETIIKEKRKQLTDLLELTRLHYCSHDHNRLSNGQGCCDAAPLDVAPADGDDASVAVVAANSRQADDDEVVAQRPHSRGDGNTGDEQDDVDVESDNEESYDGGFDDDNGGMCMNDVMSRDNNNNAVAANMSSGAVSTTASNGGFYL